MNDLGAELYGFYRGRCICDLPFEIIEYRNTVQAVNWVREEPYCCKFID